MDVSIKAANGAVFHIAARASWKVSDLKESFRELGGVPVIKQRLLFRGQILQDNEQLSQCGITEGVCINLVGFAANEPPQAPHADVPDAAPEAISQTSHSTPAVSRPSLPPPPPPPALAPQSSRFLEETASGLRLMPPPEPFELFGAGAVLRRRNGGAAAGAVTFRIVPEPAAPPFVAVLRPSLGQLAAGSCYLAALRGSCVAVCMSVAGSATAAGGAAKTSSALVYRPSGDPAQVTFVAAAFGGLRCVEMCDLYATSELPLSAMPRSEIEFAQVCYDAAMATVTAAHAKGCPKASCDCFNGIIAPHLDGGPGLLPDNGDVPSAAGSGATVEGTDSTTESPSGRRPELSAEVAPLEVPANVSFVALDDDDSASSIAGEEPGALPGDSTSPNTSIVVAHDDDSDASRRDAAATSADLPGDVGGSVALSSVDPPVVNTSLVLNDDLSTDSEESFRDSEAGGAGPANGGQAPLPSSPHISRESFNNVNVRAASIFGNAESTASCLADLGSCAFFSPYVSPGAVSDENVARLMAVVPRQCLFFLITGPTEITVACVEEPASSSNSAGGAAAYAPSESDGTVIVPSRAVRSVAPGESELSSEASDSETDSSSLSSNEEMSDDLTAVAPGELVVRGRTWSWGDQDGGPGGIGAVVSYEDSRWVRVRWFAGKSDVYRIGDGWADLALAPLSVAPRRRKLKSCNLRTGDRIQRGPTWRWAEQDGGAGKWGTVIGEDADGWVVAVWDAGNANVYQVHENQQDLIKPPRERIRRSYPPLCVGDRVIRGPSWRWANQDGAPGRLGTITAAVDKGWARVMWNNSLHVNAYRVTKHHCDIRKVDPLVTADEVLRESENPSRQRGAAVLPSPPAQPDLASQPALTALPLRSWEPDAARDTCSRCGTKWSFFTRRHHCRACGRLMCSKCCGAKVRLGVSRSTRVARVCADCASVA